MSSDSFHPGVQHLWNLCLDDAESLFVQENNIQSALHYAEVSFLRAMVDEGQQPMMEAFRRLAVAEQKCSVLISEAMPTMSNTVKARFKKILGTVTEDEENTLTPSPEVLDPLATLSQVCLFQAFLYLRRGYYVKGGYFLRKSWRLYSQCSKILAATGKSKDEEFRNARASTLFGLGFFHFFLSMVPPAFKWIVEAIGFQGDRKFGLQELQSCYLISSSAASPMALLLLLWVHVFFLHDMVSASKLAAEARQLFPTGGLFSYLEGYMYREQGKVQQAISCFTRVHAVSSNLRQLQLDATYELGWCHYLLRDWCTAASCFEDFLAEHNSPSFRAFCAFQLGNCYEMMNMRDRAVPVFGRVEAWVRRYYTFDQYAARKAQEYLREGGLFDEKRELFLASVMVEAHDFSDSQRVLSSLVMSLHANPTEPLAEEELSSLPNMLLQLARPISADSRAWLLYLMGLTRKGLGDSAAAMALFQAVVDMASEVEHETYLVPHSCAELAELCMPTDSAGAREWLQRARRDYKDYDFDKPLRRRLEKMLDDLPADCTSEPAEVHRSRFSRVSHVRFSLPSIRSTRMSPQARSGHLLVDNTNNIFSGVLEEEDEDCDSREVNLMDGHRGHGVDLVVQDGMLERERSVSSSQFVGVDDCLVDEDDRASSIYTLARMAFGDEGSVLGSLTTHSAGDYNEAPDHADWLRDTDLFDEKIDPPNADQITLDASIMSISQSLLSSNTIRIHRVWGRRHRMCFAGGDAVRMLGRSWNVSEEQSRKSLQALLDAKAVHLLRGPSTASVLLSDDALYRFQCHRLHSVINRNKVWPNEKFCPVRSAVVVSIDLAQQLEQLLQSHGRAAVRAADRSLIVHSPKFQAFALATAELQKVQIVNLSATASRAFFINIYNVLSVHTYVLFNARTKFQAKRLHTTALYDIGGFLLSCHDIFHGILRGDRRSPGCLPMRAFGTFDARHQLAAQHQMDCRLHFVAEPCPCAFPLGRYFFPSAIDKEMQWAGEVLCEKYVVIDSMNRTVTLPKLFQVYQTDFVGTKGVHELLRFVASYLSDGKRSELLDLLANCRVVFARQHHHNHSYTR